jgi:hypothetical protein
MSIGTSIELIRRLGPRWVLYRTGYALRKESGLLRRRFPTLQLERVDLADLVRGDIPTDADGYKEYREASAARFFFKEDQLPDAEALRQVVSAAGSERTLAVADDYTHGHFLYYGRHAFDLGQPVDWLINPFTGTRHESRTHWCNYETFSADAGDIKDVWEPSRFACAFWLVRAFALSGDEKYPAAFWSLFESWCEQNPPNRGPNWKCGQETALRTMAWCFALYGFSRSASTTAQRVVSLVKMLAIQTDRIAGNIGFAVSQKTNHGITEGAGLLTVGLLFPELRHSARWRAIGRRVLEHEIRRQIYEDGSYLQHSMNYHRLMLHDCIWAVRLTELNKQPLSSELTDRVRRAAEFLFQMTDPDTGRVPNYGANDGALILPLNSCDCLDYRPVVQSCWYLLHGKRAYRTGDWDEDPLWLFGPQAIQVPVSTRSRASTEFATGGYYTLATKRTWGMVRCHRYRDRVGHADPLHLDMWGDGVNLLRDCGSYRYFAPDQSDLQAYFSSLKAHNTIEVDETSPFRYVSRFTMLPWPTARAQRFETSTARLEWKGSHSTYERCFPGLVHTREIVVDAAVDRWEITDRIEGSGKHLLILRWHLPDRAQIAEKDAQSIHLGLPAGWQLRVHTAGRIQAALVEARVDGGYESLYYGEKRPIRTLAVRCTSALPHTFRTTVWRHSGV